MPSKASRRRPRPERDEAPDQSRWRRIWGVVARIPRGRVATYGQVAALAGLGGGARQVGYALAALPDDAEVPWQRVVNARGEVSARRDFDGAPRQRALLEREGVVFDAGGRIDLERFRWPGPALRRRRRDVREAT
jgi:methylated-DNA-protein-cysteine methyltransferase-like protein